MSFSLKGVLGLYIAAQSAGFLGLVASFAV